VTLGEVTDVVKDHQLMVGDGVVNEEVGILLIVEKFPWGNTLEVSRQVEAKLEQLEPGLGGIHVDPRIFRPATYIETSIENLTEAMLIGGLLVIIVLVLFLFEWRVALISVVAIPLSLMAAAVVLSLTGAALNVMILAGFVIALGAVVDDAIIGVENIMRRLRQNRLEGGTLSMASVILSASLEVRSAIIFATLIEVVVLIPVFFMESLSGTFFKPLATSYALAILASMLVALTVTPALSMILLRNASLDRREAPLVRLLQAGYDRILGPIIRNPKYAYGVVAVVVVAGIVVAPRMGQELLPSFKERDFLMHWLAKPGTSWPEMNRITIQSAYEISDIPGIQNFGAHIGQAVHMDEVVGMYFGENWVSVHPDVDYDETVDNLQTVVDGYPGIFRDVQTYLKERIREVLTGSSDAIVIRIFGQELDVLRENADQIFDKLDQIEGVVDLHVELITEIPQIEIEVDLEKAQAHGLKPGDVRRAAGALIASVEVSDLYRDGRIYDIRVIGTPERRGSLSGLKTMLLDKPDGAHVELQEVADVRIVPSPNVLKRENVARRLDVEANVKGRDLGSVYADVERVLEEHQFPQEYNAQLLGEFTERQAASKRLQWWSIAAAVGIFFLLQTSYGAWRLTLISFLTLPMALVGGILAAWLTGGVISLGSLVGFLTVLGIAARNGIMMVNHFQHLEREEGETFGPGLVLRGARERLAPILMTATTTGLALLPLVIAGNLPGHEIEHPMAIVILGGLVTSTLLNLFVVPSLYLRFARSGRNAEPVQTAPAAA
ncbi:MAG: efflux RND transporter permease subunit, partial [Dehalococcoidia bacterium]